MKNLFTLLLFAFSLVAFSQSGTSKNDIIITKDGELIQAKVLKVTSNTISFSYPGETVVNELEKVGLEKIVFSSGRTQTFANGTSASTSQPKAVVPIPKEVPPIPKEEIYLNLDPVEASIAVIPASFTLL